MKSARIYMDHNATTPLRPGVLEAMVPALTEHFGNPASRAHSFGWAAAALVDRARAQVAEGIGARPDEIVFTSGATEANNLAIKGVAASRPGCAVVTCATEHLAVLDPCKTLARHGYTVRILAVDGSGRVTADQVAEAMTPDTALVSIMLANNETGTLQPVQAIAACCREHKVLVHCDGTQAVGRIPVDLGALGVDLFSCSAHKLGGPKGVGALVVRRRAPRLTLVPLLDGGGHEQGIRSGTLNVPGIVGFGAAVALATAEVAAESARLAALRDRLRRSICSRLSGVVVNGHQESVLPNTLNLSFQGVDGNALLAALGSVALSTGSACSSASPAPSHVLTALGRSRALAAASLRFSLGWGNTAAEVDEVADLVVVEVGRLRQGGSVRRLKN